MRSAALCLLPLLGALLLAGSASAQCPAVTQAGVCAATVTTALNANIAGLVSATVCTVTAPAGVAIDPIPVPVATNGAIAVSVVNPLVAAHATPFVGSFAITYTAQPIAGCTGGGVLGVGATQFVCTHTCTVTNTGTAFGEPHFVGFDLSRYDFQGVPDAFYSLLTDNEHSLNAQFVRRGQRQNEETGEWFDLPTLEDKATWLGAVGLSHKEDSAHVTRTADGQTIVEINGQPLTIGNSEQTASGLTVAYTNKTVPDGNVWVHPGPWTLPTVTFTTERYEFEVSIPPNHDRRLDLSAKIVDAPDAKIAPAAGVLGQTLGVLYGTPLDSSYDQADVVEVWDPEEGDHIHHSQKLEEYLTRTYTVGSLFATDAARSNFGKNMPHATFQSHPLPESMNYVAAEPAKNVTVARRFLAELPGPTPTIGAGIINF